MSQPSLWTSFFWALIIHILLAGGISLYATKGFRVQMPEVYRVTIVTETQKFRVKKMKQMNKLIASKTKIQSKKTSSLRKGVTMLQRIEKIKKIKSKKRKTLFALKKAYKEEKALEKALTRIQTEKIAEIKKRLALKKQVLSTIEALPSRTAIPASDLVKNYALQVKELIRSEWVFPKAFAQKPYMVEVKFRVSSDGKVNGISIVKSSGSIVFDASVVKAIKKASPLPPPPPGAEEITIRFRTEAESEN